MENIELLSTPSSFTPVEVENYEETSYYQGRTYSRPATVNSAMSTVSAVAKASFRSAVLAYLSTAIVGTILGFPAAQIFICANYSAAASAVITALSAVI